MFDNRVAFVLHVISLAAWISLLSSRDRFAERFHPAGVAPQLQYQHHGSG